MPVIPFRREGLTAGEVETLRRYVFRTYPGASIVCEVDDMGGHHWCDAETDDGLLSANREGGKVVIWRGPGDRRTPEPDLVVVGRLRAALGMPG